MDAQQLKLVELDPSKQYVVMYHGRFTKPFKWEDKPVNVSDLFISADYYTIEDLEAAKEALLNEQGSQSAETPDAKPFGGNDVS